MRKIICADRTMYLDPSEVIALIPDGVTVIDGLACSGKGTTIYLRNEKTIWLRLPVAVIARDLGFEEDLG
jgi:hypothetical protein